MAGSKSVWLHRASFNRNLREVRLGLFKSESVYAGIAMNLSLISKDTKTALQNMGEDARASDFRGALLSLAALSAGSFLVLARKLRTE